MSDFDAVSALLMLSQGMQDPIYPQQIRAHASNNFNFYEDNHQNGPEDLSKVKRELFVHHPTANKKLLAPSTNYNTNTPHSPVNLMKTPYKQDYEQCFDQKPHASTPYTSNPHHSPPTPFFEHNYANNQFLHSTEDSIPLNNYINSYQNTPKQKHQVPKLPPPVLPQIWTNGDPRENLPTNVLYEFERIVRDSSFLKEDFVKKKTAEFPIDCEYNPKKSRLRKEYANAEEAAGRAKNNLASRRSRYKKKVQTQLMNLSLAFDKDENRDLYLQEKWLTKIIADLETKLISEKNFDVEKLKALRVSCGFK